jgi:hypothetical protein
LATGILKRIHFTMQDGTALLNPAVMPPANNSALVNNYRTDGNTTLLQAFLRLIKCGFKKLVHIDTL